MTIPIPMYTVNAYINDFENKTNLKILFHTKRQKLTITNLTKPYCIMAEVEWVIDQTHPTQHMHDTNKAELITPVRMAVRNSVPEHVRSELDIVTMT